MSAYQRWEMASFDEEPAKPAPEPDPEPEDVVERVALPTAEEVAKILDDARREGYAEGLARGLEDGTARGLAQGTEEGLESGRKQVNAEIAQLRALANNYSQALTSADELVATDLLDLALDVSKAILKTSLEARPELILPVIREALDYLPTLQQPAVLHLHPEDALLVRERMAEELATGGWRIVEDEHLERGGCRIETGSNRIDATLPTRWRRLAAALGKNLEWLGP